ncbi:hypothetical protein HY345_01600 [Candidatus Microgenomates bacterium]|nr:hypothetical protein [Candidatus Microgenomates bacterium]
MTPEARLQLIRTGVTDTRLDAAQNGAVVEQGVGLHHQITSAIASQGDTVASYATDATIATATARNTRLQGRQAARQGESDLPFKILAGITDATAAVARQRATLAKTIAKNLTDAARKTEPLHRIQRAQRKLAFMEATREFAHQDAVQEIGRAGPQHGVCFQQLDENLVISRQALQQRSVNLKRQIADGLRASRRPRAQVPPIVRTVAKAAGEIQGKTDARIKTAASDTERDLIAKELPLPVRILRRIRI